MNPSEKLGIAASALAVALAGCASTPTLPVALEQARNEYQLVKSNPDVPKYAPTELNQAGQTLGRAEQMWTRGADREDVQHQAYLAQQQARIAAETATARSARAEIEQAELQRKTTVAESRRLQALAQQRDAEAARRNAEAERLAAEQRAEAARQQAVQQQATAAQEIKRLESQLEEMKAEQTSRGWVLTLGSDVLFDVGQSVLKPGAYRSIDQIAQFMQANPDRSVVIEGYTDSTGSETLNLDLSQRRADAVKQALVARNIDPNRIRTHAFGEANPVASNDTAAGRQLNRRVELIIPNADMRAAAR
jgi:outer membrane protein OmpA-like peptidoglycan-associated protein